MQDVRLVQGNTDQAWQNRGLGAFSPPPPPPPPSEIFGYFLCKADEDEKGKLYINNGYKIIIQNVQEKNFMYFVLFGGEVVLAGNLEAVVSV